MRSWVTVVAVAAALAGMGAPAAGQSPSPSLPAALGPATLDWSAPLPGPDGYVRDVTDAADGALVAVGQVEEGRGVRLAAWRSTDGTTWERTLTAGPRLGESQLRAVAAGPEGTLVAFGNQGLLRCRGQGEGGVSCRPQPIAAYRSADGRTWERIEPDGGFGNGAVTGLAAGPLGWLAIGVDGRGRPTTWRSADGLAWEVNRPGAFDQAHVRDVAAVGDGWVIVGSTGGKETPPGGFSEPNGSRGAAWTSDDGIAWAAADVAGKGEQVELRSVFVGAGGLLAVGTLDGSNRGALWTSLDAATWSLATPGPEGWPAASDGRSIVAWSAVDDPATGAITWSVSTDGVTWTPLGATGAVETMPRWEGGITPESAVLAGDDLVVLGEGTETPNVTWVARPAEPPAPEVVLDRYLRALVAGDCDAAAAFVAGPFGVGNGDLCGAATVRSFAVSPMPARPGPDEVVFATTLDLAEVTDASLEAGSVRWFFDLQRAADGEWRIVGGGTGP